MKCANYVTMLIAFIALTSCSQGKTSKDHNAKVDFTELIREYQKFHNVDTETYEKLMEDAPEDMSADYSNSQILCCNDSWKISIPENLRKNNICDDMERMYNIIAYRNCILSDFEIFGRGMDTGGETFLVGRDTIAKAIGSMELCEHGDKTQSYAKRFRDELVGYVKLEKEETEENNANSAYIKYDEYAIYSYIINIADSAEVSDYQDNIDTLLTKYKSFEEKLDNADEGELLTTALWSIQEAETFEDQCAMALITCRRGMWACNPWTAKVIKQLIESGNYSFYLERLWLMWRSITQQQYFGISRDSYIQNDYYDRVRKKVYMSIVSYLADNPDDKRAFVVASFLVTRTGIIRNGMFMFGNDAIPDMLEVAPNLLEK